ncbi:MAG: hypothetical protein V7L01_15530 [Nostoc sp.]
MRLHILPQQGMSNDKPLRVYALFFSFSARRSLTLPQQAIALF